VIDFSQIQIPGTSSSELSGLAAAATTRTPSPEDPKALRDMILASPHDLAMLKERNPPLADALLSNSLGASFTCSVTQQSVVAFSILNYRQCSDTQGWVFAMAETIFAGTVEKTGKNRGKNWQIKDTIN